MAAKVIKVATLSPHLTHLTVCHRADFFTVHSPIVLVSLYQIWRQNVVQFLSYRASKLAKLAIVAYLGPLAAILVNILQGLGMGSISKNVPLNEVFQLSQSWVGGGGGFPALDRQTTG